VVPSAHAIRVAVGGQTHSLKKHFYYYFWFFGLVLRSLKMKIRTYTHTLNTLRIRPVAEIDTDRHPSQLSLPQTFVVKLLSVSFVLLRRSLCQKTLCFDS